MVTKNIKTLKVQTLHCLEPLYERNGGLLFGTCIDVEIIVSKAFDVSSGLTVSGDKESVS